MVTMALSTILLHKAGLISSNIAFLATREYGVAFGNPDHCLAGHSVFCVDAAGGLAGDFRTICTKPRILMAHTACKNFSTLQFHH